MKIAVPKALSKHETRVALTPEGVKKIASEAVKIIVESGAGLSASYLDEDYRNAGAEIVDRKHLFDADCIVHIEKPTDEDLASLKKEHLWISYLNPLGDRDGMKRLNSHGLTAISMELIPRITRAQKMDALSTMSSIAGYKAVLIGASALGKYMPMLMTAAGTVPPAKVMILGAGVAGLQAIATAKRLGAVVEAFDVRPVVKEQVQSLGAKFIDVPIDDDTETKGGYAKELSEAAKIKQREVIHQHVKKSDLVITTALIPGRPAPELITEEMVKDMPTGSVIVDLASENGGNCVLTKAGETITAHNVTIIGPLNLPGTMAYHASMLYSRNMVALLQDIIKDGKLDLNFEDEILKNATVTHNGSFVSPMFIGE